MCRDTPHAIYTSAKRGVCWTAYLSILKVRVKFGDRVLDTYALLDNGAAGYLIRKYFATEMGMTGTNRLIKFGTFHGSDPLLPSRTVEFELYAPNDETIRFDVIAHTTPVLEVALRRWKAPPSLTDRAYLDGVSYSDVDQGEVTILIVYDIFEAHVEMEIPRQPVGVQGPSAVRFSLGWSLCGPVFEVNQRSRAIFCISRDDQLHRQVERFIKIDSSGTRCSQPFSLTPEEVRAVQMVLKSTRLVNGLPNNRQATYKLFDHLEKS